MSEHHHHGDIQGHHHHHHKHHHRHRHRSYKSKKWDFIKRVVIAVGVMGVWAVLALAIYVFGSKLDEEYLVQVPVNLGGRFDPSLTLEWNGKTYGYREGDLKTILLIGVDDTTLESETGSMRSGDQADFLVLLVADNKSRTITPIQIDRDTITDVDVLGVHGDYAGFRTTQICLAQGFGSTLEKNCHNTVAAVHHYLCGIPINHYVVFDMAAIANFNDLLDGVTVTVQDDLSRADPAFIPGAVVKLRGKQAETFVRSRMGVSDGTNNSRMGRQRIYLSAALEQMRSKLDAEPGFAEKLIQGMTQDFSSDMDAVDLIDLSNQVIGYEVLDFRSPKGAYRIGADGFKEFYPDLDSVTELVISTCFEPVAEAARPVA